MHRPHHQLVRRQTTNPLDAPSASGLEGGATATSAVVSLSSLLLGPSVSSIPTSDSLDPNQSGNSGSTPTQTDSASSSSTSASAHPSLSTGAVLGISAAVFLVTVLTMFAVYSLFKKRTLARARQPLARGPPTAYRGTGSSSTGKERQWHQLEDREINRQARPKSHDSHKFALFEKDPSVRSLADDKANGPDVNSFDLSTMPNFAKYHPGLAEELSIDIPLPSPAIRLGGSWDGAASVGNDSFLTLHTSPSDTMSSTNVAARQTPQATDSETHRWESAEVLIMGDSANERQDIYTENPFSDDAAPRTSNDSEPRRSGGGNPFFNAFQHADPFSDRTSRSRKSSISTAKRARSNSASTAGTVHAEANDHALLSLIAALDAPTVATDDQSHRVSTLTMTSSVYPIESHPVPTTPKAF
ncbi:hypothetical protein BGW80DRAFT_1316332 [Lactifluus volemus]|nr:hypothetical protein BGW80DRAFT_1316332 [Lactifluus volemus]